MRSRTGNSLSTLMFLVPLLGVPLMAIFGVPQFVPVIASSVSEDVTRPTGLKPKRRVGESVAAATFEADSSPISLDQRRDPPLQDFFRPTDRPRRDSRPIHDADARGREPQIIETSLNTDNWLTQAPSDEPLVDSNAKLNDLFGTSAATANSKELPGLTTRSTTARTRSEPAATRTNATRFVSDSEQSPDGLTWREAVSRLNELGIQEFRLEPGSRRGAFYFACEFTPHRDARVTRRFEAEATEPLLAVQTVLRQIDEWLTRR